jgi:hypothetical protein
MPRRPPEIRKSKRERRPGEPVLEAADVRPRLMSLPAAARVLGEEVTVWQVRGMIWRGILPVVRLGGRRLYIDRRDLDEMIERARSRYLP